MQRIKRKKKKIFFYVDFEAEVKSRQNRNAKNATILFEI